MPIDNIPSEVSDYLRTRVWSGFYESEELIEQMIEDAQEGVITEEELDLSDEEIAALVHAEIAKKKAAEASWPAQTDCDRLTAAFKELTSKGILALENAGYTQSDGWSDIDEIISKNPKGTFRGGCFYHGQDLERAVDGGGIFITFSARSGIDADNALIANEIVSTLRSHDLKPEWEGDPKTRVKLPLNWQRRNSA